MKYSVACYRYACINGGYGITWTEIVKRGHILQFQKMS